MNIAPFSPHQPAAASAGAAREEPRAGVRAQRFVDLINQALDDDARLKADDPRLGLSQQELTTLQRERDRLAPLCDDAAGSLALAAHLGDRVTNTLVAAARGAGLGVSGYAMDEAGAQASPARPTCSLRCGAAMPLKWRRS